MNWQDYQEIDHSTYGGVGLLAGDYVCTMKIQAQMITQFRKITKEEFDTFAVWKDDKETWENLRLRTIQWQGYFLSHEFQECGKDFHHVKR